MVCRAVDINNPYLWIFLTGLFAGAGFGRLPFLYGRNHPCRETGTAGWIFVSAAFSLAVFSAVSSVFFPAGGLFGDGPVDLSFLEGYDWLFLILAGFIFGFLIRRFPRAAGIPLVILSAGIIFFSFQAFRSWSCYEADEEILRIRIAAEGDVTAAKFTFPSRRRAPVDNSGAWDSACCGQN